MKPQDFLNEDADDDMYKSNSRIKRQVIPTSHKASKLQDICTSKNIKRGDKVFVKEGNDYQHCVFLRAGEKMIHVHNYVNNYNEAVDPKEVYTQENFKYVPLIEPKKKGAKVKEALEDADDDRYPEFMGGYVTPFTANGAWVLDNEGTQVLKCDNPRFARVVEIALNKSRQGKI